MTKAKATMPTVSIMMPAYNGQIYVERAIASVLAQTYRDFELVVVDDGSTDDTVAIVQRFADRDSRVRLIERESNGGEGASRNTALASFSRSSDYVAFLDCDDVWEPASLEVRVAALESAPASVGCYGRYRHVDATGSPLNDGRETPAERWTIARGRRRRLADNEPNTFASVAYRFCYVPGALLVRKDVIDRCGHFDPTLRIATDDDMFLRIAAHGPIEYVDRLVLSYRIHGSNVTNDRLALEQSTHLVYQRYLAAGMLDADQRRVLRYGYTWAIARLMRARAAGIVRNVRHGQARRAVADVASLCRCSALLARQRVRCWVPAVNPTAPF